MELPDTYMCKECNTCFADKKKLGLHHECCKEHQQAKLKEKLRLEFDKEIHILIETHNKELEKKHIEIAKLLIDNEHNQEYINKLEQKVSKYETMMESLVKDSLNKSSTTHHTTIENQYNAVLSQTHTIDSMDIKEVENTIRKHYTESIFTEGQKGIARMCVNYIIKAPDGKLALCCTDPARKKFKMFELDGKLRTDYNVSNFCKIIKQPVCKLNQEICDKKIDRIQERMKLLNSDQTSTHLTLIKDIENIQKICIANCWFDDTKYNMEFIGEMCKLLYIK